MIEIERKFLVTTTKYREEATLVQRIVQGFLNTHPERTVRVRITGDTAYITVKGKSNTSGMSRFEWEKEIPVAEAESLLSLCEEGKIEKTRYKVPLGTYWYEVDEFKGANEGLILAEIELPCEEAVFPTPEWLGNEVTGDIRYYNSQLSKHPYTTWK
ncbi:CYTH domain-containing protein [Ascidiimonas aurantiaca]|uniref:CYTH domain-containing protein n=1 Tax=Ascidiimonas aurantiaca TaxID=1685432 RepID=UPI0030EE55BE